MEPEAAAAGEVAEGRPLLEGITHRILAFLFQQRHREGVPSSDALRRFFYSFEAYATLVIWKVCMR